VCSDAFWNRLDKMVEFSNSSWTDILVWLSLPFVNLLLVVLVFVRGTGWETEFVQLKRPSYVPDTRRFHYIGIGTCVALGLGGLLTQHLGDVHQSPMNVGLTFLIVQLVLLSGWLTLMFTPAGAPRHLWTASVVAVMTLVSASFSLIACALATGWSLFGLLPYWLVVAFGTAATGQIAFSNHTFGTLPGAASSSSGGKQVASSDTAALTLDEQLN
jgi:tryptophan-rich sensory protein